MPRFRKLPVEVEAVRYGKDEDGSWYKGAASRVARFMLGEEPDAALNEGIVSGVLQPTGLWDPPENTDLMMWDGIAHNKWLPLSLGDWVIKGVQGEFYPCKPDIFKESYEPVDVTHLRHAIDGYPLCWSIDQEGEAITERNDISKINCTACLTFMKEV